MTLRASRWLHRFVLVTYALAGVAVACTFIWPWGPIVGLAGALSGLWAARRQISQRAGLQIALCNDRTLQLNGHPAQLQRAFVTSWCVVLYLQDNLRQTLVIAADCLDAESFRHLRRWACWGRVSQTGTWVEN